MARPKKPETENTPKHVVAARLSDRERDALAALVAMEQREIDAAGHTFQASPNNTIRRLIRKEAMAQGLWDALPAAPAPQAALPFAPTPAAEPKPEPAPAPVVAPAPEPPTKPTPKPAPREAVHKRLVQFVEAGKGTVKEIAEAIGMARSTVATFKSSPSKMSPDTLAKLDAALAERGA